MVVRCLSELFRKTKIPFLFKGEFSEKLKLLFNTLFLAYLTSMFIRLFVKKTISIKLKSLYLIVDIVFVALLKKT